MKQSTRRCAAASLIALLVLTMPGASAQTVQTSTSTYVYDVNGRVTKVTDPLNRVIDLAYDVYGRPTLHTLPAPQAGTSRPVIQTSYDGRDQVATVTDPRKLITTYTVDGLGNQGALDSPDTGRTVNTYDLSGNLQTSTDARGKVTAYAYDAINRVTRINYPAGAASVFSYDGGGIGSPGAVGKLTGMTDESGNTTYGYDAFGRVASKAQTVAATTLSVGYAYGASGTATGKLASITYPSGNRVNYLYDDAGRLSRLTLDPAGDGAAQVDLLTGIDHAPFGGVQSWYWGNSTADAVSGYARTFDLDGRITSYTLGNVATTGVLRHVNYDAAGRILGYTHDGASAVVLDQTFAYDNLDRLTGSQSATTSLGFAYDVNGNRTQASVGSNSYANVISPGSNRLLSTTGPAPARSNVHDAAGNLVSDGTASYMYSDRGRLQRAVKAGLTTEYLYNGIGQRVSKTGAAVPTGANYFVYDEQGHVLGEYSATGAALQETVYLGDTPVVVLANGVSYVYADHLDTPRLITRSSDGAIVWRWDTADPFGVALPQENPSGLGIFTYNLRFPGQLFDRETNNHYNFHRDYDPQTGRYIQSDPIGLGGGLNTYVYGLGDPVLHSDPSGLLVPPPSVVTWAGTAAGTAAGTGGAGVAAAGAAGLAIGLGFNALWERGAGQSFGGSIYDLLNPQMSEKQDRRDSHNAYKAVQRKGYARDPNDPCQELRNRIAYLEWLIAARKAHDVAHPNPGWPNGQRHAGVNAADQANLNRLYERLKNECCD